jgi:multiple RNA-binding domain-containing protein 1
LKDIFSLISQQTKPTKRKRQVEKEQQTSKILVKNIPFQANIREIRELFRVFGELKFVRMPKKIDDEHHRGFGFVDFISKNDAKVRKKSTRSIIIQQLNLI